MELSQAPRWCLVCDGLCREPMHFTRVIARDRVIDINDHEDDADMPATLTPIGKRARR